MSSCPAPRCPRVTAPCPHALTPCPRVPAPCPRFPTRCPPVPLPDATAVCPRVPLMSPRPALTVGGARPNPWATAARAPAPQLRHMARGDVTEMTQLPRRRHSGADVTPPPRDPAPRRCRAAMTSRRRAGPRGRRSPRAAAPPGAPRPAPPRPYRGAANRDAVTALEAPAGGGGGGAAVRPLPGSAGFGPAPQGARGPSGPRRAPQNPVGPRRASVEHRTAPHGTELYETPRSPVQPRAAPRAPDGLLYTALCHPTHPLRNAADPHTAPHLPINHCTGPRRPVPPRSPYGDSHSLHTAPYCPQAAPVGSSGEPALMGTWRWEPHGEDMGTGTSQRQGWGDWDTKMGTPERWGQE